MTVDKKQVFALSFLFVTVLRGLRTTAIGHRPYGPEILILALMA